MSDTKYYKRNDDVYYNIKIVNNNVTTSVPAIYQESRLTPVIGDDVNDYYCAVARFKVPASSIPIFIFQNGAYTVTITGNNGIDYPNIAGGPGSGTFVGYQQLLWLPEDPGSPNYVWNYNSWAEYTNNALLVAYNQMPSGIKPSAPPFVVYNSLDQLYTLYATNEYNSVANDGTKAQIWMNVGTFSKYEYWNADFGDANSNKFANILIKQKGNNAVVASLASPNTSTLNTPPAVDGITYYGQTQEQKGLFLLSDFDSIVLASSSIPVNPEQFGSVLGLSTDRQQYILTDFQPSIDNQIGDRGYFIYIPTIYRWFDIPSTNSLVKFDVQIYWKDVRGVLHLIYLYYNDVADIKLLFKKKYKHVVVDKNLK